MSFSGEVKEELVKLEGEARHCQIAELAAILIFSQAIRTQNGKVCIEFSSETPYACEKSRALAKSLFGDGLMAEKILQTIKYSEGESRVNPIVIKSICCKRAFLRGAFLGAGSMSNPQKGYHLEFVCADEVQAAQIVDTLIVFDIKAKIVQRKKYHVVYIKESEERVDTLNVMGAHVALMDLENLRILKDMRNSINRRVNCEAANITKTVNAATKQIEDIEYIKNHYGFENLAQNLREIAELRLELPEATLKELGESLGVGKSGVNHRLRRLGELAEKLREEKG
jgi:hypothetical protein